MGKFKKGDEVWVIANYDGNGTVSICRETIQSWGAKRGTATRASNGEFIKSAIWVSSAENPQPYHPHYYLVGSVDPEVAAHAFGVRFLEYKRKHFATCRKHFEGASPSYFEALDRDEALLHEVRIIKR